MSNKLSIIIFSFSFLLIMGPCLSFDDSTSCFRNLETGFFKRDVVIQAMSLYRVNRASWNPILRRLDERSEDIPKKIRANAKRMKPNPIENPFDPSGAEELLFQALFEVFFDVMTEFRVESADSINGMFDYIINRQESKIQECMPKETANLKNP